MQTGLATNHQQRAAKSFIRRFFACYFFIYAFPFPFSYISFAKFLNDWYNRFLNIGVSFCGKYIFNIPFSLTATGNGSGDTTYNYVRLFVVFLLALLVTIVWLIIDRKQKNSGVVLYWVLMYLRFYLALIMVRYGLEKVIKTQFAFPFYSLNETYGSSSPMRLLWTFMGYSTAFNVFTGVIEIAAGIFILFRKTTTFGLLLCSIVLANVVVINFCFDVPVKIFSANLLLLTFFLLSPDIKRIADFFFRNKAAPAKYDEPRFAKPGMQPAWTFAKVVIIIVTSYAIFMFVKYKYIVLGDGAFTKTPLFGIYSVEKFVNKSDTANTINESAQWKTLNIIFSRHGEIDFKNNTTKAVNFSIDTSVKKIELYENDDSTNKSVLNYFLPDSTHLILDGKLQDDLIHIELRKQNLNEFPLLQRKFHWISEAPYNK